jgi:beta-lactamase class A
MGASRLAASLVVAAAACVAAIAPPRAAPPSQQARAELMTELSRLGAASGGRLGLSALHLESGERVQVNAAERFPMASTYKLALALKVLDEVDRKRLGLQDAIPIDESNLSPGSGEIAKESRPGTQRSATVRELLSAMIRESDNTASDLLMERVGGAPAVTLHLRSLGLDQIDVSRPAAQLSADAWGFRLPPPGERTAKALAHARGQVKGRARAAAAARFLADPRDTATPDDMAALLARIQAGKAASRAGTELLLADMRACRTGPRRIRGELPRGMEVAHKTGTLMLVATNDVGIVTLPWNGSHVAMAIFLKGSKQPIAQQERTIAYAARALYRYWK